MEIRLNNLVLENFKGVTDFSLAPNGRSCAIKGRNATGKTSCMDGFLWLLFNKDSLGRADFPVKTLDASGNPLHNLDHSVEAQLDIDGDVTTLKKVFKEQYTKRRGSPTADFTGHTTDYYIDGVPTKKKDWDSQIQNLINEDTFKLLTSPTYFNGLHWQKRRQILLEVFGDISDDAVIASRKALSSLPEILGNKSLENYRKIVASQKKEINDRLKEIPARIDELSKSITDVLQWDAGEINVRIEELEKQIQAAKDNTHLSTFRGQRAELSAELKEANAKKRAAETERTEKAGQAAARVKARIQAIRDEIEEVDRVIRQNTQKIKVNDAMLESLREDFTRLADQEFSGDTVCPACGQDLPAEEVAAAIELHREDKAKKLAKINQQGKRLKTENEGLSSDNVTQEKYKTTIRGGLAEVEAELEKAVAERGRSAPAAQDDAIDKEIAGIESQLEDLDKKIAENAPPDTVESEIELRMQKGRLAQIDSARRMKKRAEELTDEEKMLAKEYEELERQSYLMDQFIVRKVDMLEDRINSKFELVQFKLFDIQVNGAIAETCVATVEGIPAGSGLNTGGEINSGLDIIRTLSRYYDIKAPVFIDHAESVTDLLDPETQTIKLAVDEDCPALEVTYV